MPAAVDVARPQNPVETTEDCRYCWMCRQACPVGHVTARETLTPHGWALTIASVRRGTIAWTDETVDVLYACADCGLCRAHCITDRPLPEAITATRAEVVAAGKAPAVVKELNDRLLRTGTVYSGPAGAPAATDIPAAPTSPARPYLGENIPAGGQVASFAEGASAGGPVASSAREQVESPAGGQVASFADGASAGGRVASSARGQVGAVGDGGIALFLGDSALLGTREVEGAVALLGAVGVQVRGVGAGRSNGVVASSLGLVDTASMLARGLIAEVEASGCRELLVLTPEDRFAFERVYRDRLGLAWPASVVVREVTSVLAEALAARRLVFRPRAGDGDVAYAYHDPCHTARIDRDDAAPRALLAAALGSGSARALFWRQRRAHPCGATGGLQFTQPAIAAKLADARLADARAAGVSWLITDDPCCAHHLRSRPQQDIKILGLYELLAERLVLVQQ